MVVITIPGEPQAWKRAGRKGEVYYDQQKAEKEAIAWRCRVPGRKPISNPCRMTLTFIFKKPTNGTLAYPRPDIDNLAKLVLDAVNSILYVDDKQVVSLQAEKMYGPVPQTIITMEPA
jgi:Holliday junction resolvase RusA-like endonuclease